VKSACREIKRLRERTFWNNNKDALNAKRRERYKNLSVEEKALVREKVKAYCRKEQKKRSKTRAEYDRKNRLKVNAVKRAWASKNRSIKGSCLEKRESAVLENSKEELQKIVEWELSKRELLFNKCVYCQQEFPAKIMHVDHFFPISKGGKHSVENLVISCPSCNCSKGAKDPFEFIRKLVFLDFG
jgi:5-methylcytosine-specific restriction endonuclease McrA